MTDIGEMHTGFELPLFGFNAACTTAIQGGYGSLRHFLQGAPASDRVCGNTSEPDIVKTGRPEGGAISGCYDYGQMTPSSDTGKSKIFMPFLCYFARDIFLN